MLEDYHALPERECGRGGRWGWLERMERAKLGELCGGEWRGTSSLSELFRFSLGGEKGGSRRPGSVFGFVVVLSYCGFSFRRCRIRSRFLLSHFYTNFNIVQGIRCIQSRRIRRPGSIDSVRPKRKNCEISLCILPFGSFILWYPLFVFKDNSVSVISPTSSDWSDRIPME